MPSNSKFTRDDNNNAAIRIMANDNTVTNSDSMFTTDDNGNTAVRVVFGEGSGGGGGSDPRNLGWYATQSALETAHPTAEDGDWAIVGSTDTVWVWDSDTTAWKDTDQKGQVTSVNGQTGVVTLGINDVAPTQTDKSGYVLGTDGFVAGWVKPEIVQRSALPQASEEEVDKIYQYVGTTDATYTNGYFYKCVSDGATPTPAYSWERIDVQPASGGNFVPQLTELPEASADLVGKIVQYVGTDVSEGGEYFRGLFYRCYGDGENYWWDICKVQSDFQNIPQFSEINRLVPDENDWMRINYYTTCDGMIFQYSGQDIDEAPITGNIISYSETISDVQLDVDTFVAYETPFTHPTDSVVPYLFAYYDGVWSVSGVSLKLSDLTDFGITYTGTPSDGDSIEVQLSSGSAAYKSGYFYQVTGDIATAKCKIAQTTGATLSDLAIDTGVLWADDIATTLGVYNFEYLGDSNWQAPDGSTIPQIALQDTYGITFTGTPSVGDVITVTTVVPWKQIYTYNQKDVQPGSSLPSQTGNAGKFLTTDGTDASWSDKPLVNTATGNYSLTILGGAASESNCVNIGVNSTVKQYGTVIGYFARSNNTHCIAIGNSSFAFGASTIAIGTNAQAVANNSIQISTKNSLMQNLDANTVKIANANGNFEIMSADGTIPTDRFTTTPVADGTYVPTITISSGTATRSWSAPAGGSTSATATLTVNDWSSNTQTVNVTGVTASNNVIVAPAPASAADYAAAGILCVSQATDSLTFQCDTVPTNAITVNVIIMGA